MEEENHFKTVISRGRWQLNKHLYLSMLAILIGFLAGYGALLFRYAIKGAQYLFYQNTEDILTFAHTLPFYLKIGLPALGGLIVGPLIYFGARESKGEGVPQVMEAVALHGGRIRPRVAFATIIASGITIGSGGSVGREGPIVQIGASIGSTVAQILKVPALNLRTLVGCGAAAGIAATFNAPIAGVLFAFEVILGDFGLATFSPLILASVTATTISRHYFGNFPAFFIPPYKLVSLWEFLFYPLLGIAAGFVALLFISTLNKSEDLFDGLRMPGYLKPALGGFILGLILLIFPHVFGVGYGAINLSLMNQMPALLLFSLIFIKIISTCITLGSGSSGGIIAPSLFVGAMTGGFFGWGVNQFFPFITADPGAYALVGMGGLIAATLHAPITAIILIFELTATYTIILPLMITCILSTLIATSFKRGSIYTIRLVRKGVDIFQSWEQHALQSIRVQDIMNNRIDTVPESMPLLEIMNNLKEKDVSFLQMVNGKGALTGIISFRDIRPALQEDHLGSLVVARDLARIGPWTLKPSDSLRTALEKMSRRGVSQMPVVAEDDPTKIVGSVSHKDVMGAYNYAVLERQEKE